MEFPCLLPTKITETVFASALQPILWRRKGSTTHTYARATRRIAQDDHNRIPHPVCPIFTHTTERLIYVLLLLRAPKSLHSNYYGCCRHGSRKASVRVCSIERSEASFQVALLPLFVTRVPLLPMALGGVTCMKFSSPLRAGGKSASAFTLAKATLGAGALAMPSSFMQGGIIISVIMLLALGWMSMISINMIGRAQTHSGKDTFEDIVRLYYNAWIGYFFELTMVLFCFGTAVAYLISIADLLNPVFTKWIGEDHAHEWYGVLLLNRTVFSAIVTYLFLLPLSLVERINNVRWVSFAGVMAVILLAICIVYLFIKHGVHKSSGETLNTYLWPTGGFADLISAASSYIFAYVCQVNVPHIYSEMEPFSERNLRIVSIASVGLCFIVYFFIGICGFLLYGNATKGSIINSMKADFIEGNVFVTIAFLFMGIAVLAAYPLNIYPIRASCISTIKGITGRTRLNRWIGPIIVVVAVSVSLVVAIYLPDLKVILDLVGSMTGSIICYIIPAGFCVRIAFYKRNKLVGKLSDENIKEEDNSMDYPNWLSYGFIAFGTVFVVVGTYVSLVGLIQYYK